jgi:hypothetical protein
MRIFSFLLSTLSTIYLLANATNEICNTGSATNNVQDSVNGCITFTLGQGTGCEWMCNYCATNLGTNNYYFTGNPPVCTYQSSTNGCVGSPVSGQSYTCCAASE